MEWIERRAGLIGIGAIFVAALALGVAIADHRSSDHRGPFLGVARQYVGPLEPGAPAPGSPFARRFGLGPDLRPGGALPRRFDTGPGGALPLPGFAAGGPLHGELTVPAPNGTYQTVDVQRGKVTKITASELTVRSDDGYTKTYSASASWLRGLEAGDQVAVRATVAKGKATVTELTSTRIRR